MYRIITQREGKQIAENNDIDFFENSAKTRKAIETCLKIKLQAFDAKFQNELNKHKNDKNVK